MQRLSIGLVVHDLHNHGGHSIYSKILADEFSRRHDVAVFANRCERPPDARWEYHHVRAWRSSALSTVHSFPLGLRRYSTQLGKYQIRHMQGYCGGDPNVVTAHICVTAYLDSLRDVSPRHRLSLQSIASAEESFYRRYQGHVIAISRKIADELRELYGVTGPISVIPHGVDLARFDDGLRCFNRVELRSQLGIEEDDIMALYAGDLTKSHSYLKELSAAAPRVKFVIVTPSRAYHWSSPNVRILPPTSELHLYYAAADAFVFPTTYDSFGMVVLEAMASGLPVFSSDQAGAAELITSGKDGFVMPLNEWVGETAERLNNLRQLREIGSVAKQTAGGHDWSTVVAAVEQIYFEVVTEGPI